MDDIRGESGELIDRLIALLNNDALGDGAWYPVGIFAVMALGGAALARVFPDTGEDPSPVPMARRSGNNLNWQAVISGSS